MLQSSAESIIMVHSKSFAVKDNKDNLAEYSQKLKVSNSTLFKACNTFKASLRSHIRTRLSSYILIDTRSQTSRWRDGAIDSASDLRSSGHGFDFGPAVAAQQPRESYSHPHTCMHTYIKRNH